MYPPDEHAPPPDHPPGSHPDEAAAPPLSPETEGLYAPVELSYPVESETYHDGGFADADPESATPGEPTEWMHAAPPGEELAIAPPMGYEYVPFPEGDPAAEPPTEYAYLAPVEEGHLPPPEPGEAILSASEPFPVLEPENVYDAPGLTAEVAALPVYEPSDYGYADTPPEGSPAYLPSEESLQDAVPPGAAFMEDALPPVYAPTIEAVPAPVASTPGLPPPPPVPDEEVALLCEGLERFLGEAEARVHVLRGVSLRLEPGYVHAVVGPSGCGKSSLLYILGLLDRPDAGRMVISGRPVANLPDDELSRQRNALLGFIFQFHFLLQDFTALENIMIPMRQLGNRNEAEMRDRAHFLLDAVGLGEKSHRPSRHLSGGEQQRVAIARALANDPQVILADEPTGNLDTANSTRVFSLLTDLVHRQNKALLLVTHNPSIADACDWVHTMRDGLIVEQHFAGKRG